MYRVVFMEINKNTVVKRFYLKKNAIKWARRKCWKAFDCSTATVFKGKSVIYQIL